MTQISFELTETEVDDIRHGVIRPSVVTKMLEQLPAVFAAGDKVASGDAEYVVISSFSYEGTTFYNVASTLNNSKIISVLSTDDLELSKPKPVSKSRDYAQGDSVWAKGKSLAYDYFGHGKELVIQDVCPGAICIANPMTPHDSWWVDPSDVF